MDLKGLELTWLGHAAGRLGVGGRTQSHTHPRAAGALQLVEQGPVDVIQLHHGALHFPERAV